MSAKVLPLTERKGEWEAGEIRLIDIGRVLYHPINPRGEVQEDEKLLELAASIKSKGILEPLLVTPYRDAFYAVAGNRRRKAAGLAGLARVPCIVREIPDDEALELMMIENMQRQNLNPVQEARGFHLMMTTGRRSSVADIVKRVGVSATCVVQRLSILKLARPVQDMFEMELLPIGAAPILSLVADTGRQKAFAIKAVQAQIPLHRLEAMIREAEDTPKRTGKPTGPHKTRKKVLGEYEVFTRSEAVHELAREGVVSYAAISQAFDDICDGTCVEDDGGREMCEACPAPRMIASLLRRSGVEIKGRG